MCASVLCVLTFSARALRAQVDIFAADMEGQMAADVAQAGGFDKVESWLRDRMGASARPRVIGLTLDATG